MANMTRKRVEQPSIFAQEVETAFGRATAKAAARLQAAGAPIEGDGDSEPLTPVTFVVNWSPLKVNWRRTA
jgi:hypothetical protein